MSELPSVEDLALRLAAELKLIQEQGYDPDDLPTEEYALWVRRLAVALIAAHPFNDPPIDAPTRQISLAQLAKALNMDVRTVKKQIATGEILAKQISNRLWVADLDQIHELNPHGDLREVD